MDEQWLWMLLGVGELLSVLVLLLLVSWVRNLAARRRDKRAISALIAKTRTQKEARLAQISSFLSGQFGMRDEALGLAVRAVYKAEVRLIQAFASTYLNRDAGSAAYFGGKVEASTEPYWALSGEAASTTESLAADTVDGEAGTEALADDGELKHLRGENDRLSEELRVTMDTMSRMLTEYSTIFAKDASVADITVVEEEAAADGEAATEAQVEADIAEPAGVVADSVEDDTETLVHPDAIPATASALDDDPDAIFAVASVEPAEAVADTDTTEAAASEAAPAVDDAEALMDPDAILAAASAVDDDPDAIFAAASAEPAEADETGTTELAASAAAQVGEDAEALVTEADAILAEEVEAGRFAVDLDSAMKDLSEDPEADQDHDLTDEESQQAKVIAERNRVIDADS